MVNLPLLDVSPSDYGDEEEAMVLYRAEGTRRALAMDNRGPIKFDENGSLDAAILDAYSKLGFYIFEKAIPQVELDEFEIELADLLERAPRSPGINLDRRGRRSFNSGRTWHSVSFVKPLSDPIGGTRLAHGRHPAKMIEPEAPKDSPRIVLQNIYGPLQYSEACLRMYGHPGLLAVAAAVNGSDFAPFNEAIWIKHPHLGGSVAWHQDGWAHWNSPDLDNESHGFNFMVQVYGCDAANGLWVVPESHKGGRADIKGMVESIGSDRLPDAIPLICGPGDVAIVNRQCVHGSFANTSPNVRVTINLGFHRRRRVLGLRTGGVHNPVSHYTEDYIRSRSRLIMYAIDARRQRFPDEEPFNYEPLAAHSAEYQWTPEIMDSFRDYNRQDIGI